MYEIESHEMDNLRGCITIDDYPDNPREWGGNVGTIAYCSSRYTLGDERLEDWQIREIVENKSILSFPVYAYIHSEIQLSLKPFSCPWDSGQCGIIYVPYAKLDRLGLGKCNDEDIKKMFQEEIATFNEYLNGEVYTFIIEEVEECGECGGERCNIVDSCYGIYGLDYARKILLENMKTYKEGTHHDL